MKVNIPEIDRITSFDGYRDGGSLSASFLGCVGERYELFFKVIIETYPDFKQIGFCRPTLTAYYPCEYKSKFTGYVHQDSTEKCFGLSWEEASILLENMKYLIDNFESMYIFEDTSPEEIDEIRRESLYFYKRMVEVAISNVTEGQRYRELC
jgi:hypothetical protein